MPLSMYLCNDSQVVARLFSLKINFYNGCQELQLQCVEAAERVSNWGRWWKRGVGGVYVTWLRLQLVKREFLFCNTKC